MGLPVGEGKGSDLRGKVTHLSVVVTKCTGCCDGLPSLEARFGIFASYLAELPRGPFCVGDAASARTQIVNHPTFVPPALVLITNNGEMSVKTSRNAFGSSELVGRSAQARRSRGRLRVVGKPQLITWRKVAPNVDARKDFVKEVGSNPSESSSSK